MIIQWQPQFGCLDLYLYRRPRPPPRRCRRRRPASCPSCPRGRGTRRSPGDPAPFWKRRKWSLKLGNWDLATNNGNSTGKAMEKWGFNNSSKNHDFVQKYVISATKMEIMEMYHDLSMFHPKNVISPGKLMHHVISPGKWWTSDEFLTKLKFQQQGGGVSVFHWMHYTVFTRGSLVPFWQVRVGKRIFWHSLQGRGSQPWQICLGLFMVFYSYLNSEVVFVIEWWFTVINPFEISNRFEIIAIIVISWW